MRIAELPLVPRPRLTERLQSSSVGLVEAGAGYGKSVLASQYRQALGIATAYVPLGPPDRDPRVLIGSLRRALAGARLSDLLAATEVQAPEQWIESLLDVLAGTAEEVLLIFDDVHHLQSPEAAGLLIRLAGALPTQHRLLAAGRSFARRLDALWSIPGAASLGSVDMAFTGSEIGALLRAHAQRPVAEHDIRVALEATQGWATALVLTAATGSSGRGPGSPPDGAQVGDPVTSQLRGILSAIAPSHRTLVQQLAHLPLLSPELCDAIAGREGAFEAIVAAGIPLGRNDLGWWELPGPVVGYLTERGPLARDAAGTAATVYLEQGESLAALRVLVAGGLPDGAASLLGELTPERAEGLGLGVVQDLVESFPGAVVDRHPAMLLHLARLAETAHQPELRARTLERAAAAFGSETSSPFAREVGAERARDLMWDERTRTEAGDLARAVIDAAGTDEPVARLRALDVLGRLASWFSSSGPQPEAEAMLLESARLARRVRQPTWTAQALTALGAGFYFALCRYEQALDVLDQALAELPARNRYRATIQSFRVDALIELERWLANGSTTMSPATRRDPFTTRADGRYAWDVLPGYYRIAASHAGCTAKGSGKKKTVLSKVLPVPPPALDVELTLACPHLARTTPKTELRAAVLKNSQTVDLLDVVIGSKRHPATGLVTFRAGGKVLGAAPVDTRTHEALLTATAPETKRFTASYSGDGYTKPAEATARR